MMSILFPRMILYERYGLEKGIHFCNLKDGGIMVSEFLLPFARLNLSSLNLEKRQEVIKKFGLTHIEAIEIFEYWKNNDGYWDRAKLYQQVVNKALPIAEALYPRYLLLFLFNNTTSHFMYAKDVLQIKDINKGVDGQQPQLCNK